MEKNFNDIDHLFKEELGGYTEAPPPAVWDALEKRLKGEDKRRSPFGWYWYVGIISFIALLGSSVAWKMLRDGDNHARTQSNLNTAAAIPQHTVSSAGNTQPTVGNMPIATGAVTTVLKHSAMKHAATRPLTDGSIGNNNNSEEKTNVRHSAHSTTYHVKKAISKNNTKATRDDLYADTEDDTYTVGSNSSTHRNDEADGYVTRATTQHNIRVAESNPEEHARETNYGSHSYVSDSKARSAASTHYDIDLNDERSQEQPSAGDHRSKNRSASYHEQLYASTTKHIAKHTHAVNTAMPSSAFAEPPKVVKAHVKKHNTPAPTANASEIKVATNATKQSHKTRPAVTRKNKKSETVVATTTTGVNKKQNAKANDTKEIAMSKTVAGDTKAPRANAEQKQTIRDQSVAMATPAAATQKADIRAAESATKEVNKASTGSTDIVAATTDVPKHSTVNTSKSKESSHKTNNSANAHEVANAALARGEGAKHSAAKATEAKNNTRPVVPASVALADVTTGAPHHASKPRAENGKDVKPNGHNAKAVTTPQASTPVVTEKAITKKNKKHHSTTAIVTTDTNEPEAKHTAADIAKKTVQTTDNYTSSSGTAAVKKNTVKIKDSKEPVGYSSNKMSKTTTAKHQKQAGTDKKITSNLSKTVTEEMPARETTEKAIARKKNEQPKKEHTRSTGKSDRKTTTPVAAAQPVYAYSNSLLKRSVEDETVLVDNLKVKSFVDNAPISSSSEEMLPGTFKKDIGQDDAKTAAAGNATDNNDTTSARHLFSRKFEAGVKTGFESAYNKFGGNKIVVSPYLQYNLSDKFSIMAQPSIKVSNASRQHVGKDSVYNDTTGGKYTATSSGALYTVVYVGGIAVIVQNTLTKYNYAYDSIVKSYATGGTYMEIELPLLLKYKIGKGLSVYGGVNSIYSKYYGVKEYTNHYSGTYHTLNVLPAGVGAMQPITTNLNLPGTPISQYSGPSYPEQKGGLLRMGYMLGFSYEYKKRWLVDLLVQQAMVQPHYEAGYNTNLPLSLPYFRFTLGYKLTK